MRVLRLILIAIILSEASLAIIRHTNANLPTFNDAVYIPYTTRRVVASDVERLTNEYRISKGLNALTHDERLCSAAVARMNDMVTYNYFAHNTPDGRKPWTFFSGKYLSIGENLSLANNTASATVIAWEKSPEHNENLLLPIYTKTCVASTNKFGGNSDLVVAWYGNI